MMIWFVGGSALDLNRGYTAYMNSFSFQSHRKGCNMMIHSLQPHKGTEEQKTTWDGSWLYNISNQKNLKHTCHSFLISWLKWFNDSFKQSQHLFFLLPNSINLFRNLFLDHAKASTLVSVTASWSVPFDSGGLPVLGYKAVLGTVAGSWVPFCWR